jgi:hypothetical protein
MPISLSASSRSLRPSVVIVFSALVPYTYTVALEKVSLHFVRKRRHYLDFLFFIQVYRSLKSCTSLLENVSLHVPTSNLREFSLFCACPSNKQCPSARCAYAAKVADEDLDIFPLGNVSLNYINAPNCNQNELLLILLCYNFLL